MSVAATLKLSVLVSVLAFTGSLSGLERQSVLLSKCSAVGSVSVSAVGSAYVSAIGSVSSLLGIALLVGTA